MNVIKTEIPDVLIFEPKVFGDERGFFLRVLIRGFFEEAVGRKVEFVQDNHSKSSKGVLRGLLLSVRTLCSRKNWCAVLLARFLMLRLIFVNRHLHLGNGLG